MWHNLGLILGFGLDEFNLDKLIWTGTVSMTLKFLQSSIGQGSTN